MLAAGGGKKITYGATEVLKPIEFVRALAHLAGGDVAGGAAAAGGVRESRFISLTFISCKFSAHIRSWKLRLWFDRYDYYRWWHKVLYAKLS